MLSYVVAAQHGYAYVVIYTILLYIPSFVAPVPQFAFSHYSSYWLLQQLVGYYTILDVLCSLCTWSDHRIEAVRTIPVISMWLLRSCKQRWRFCSNINNGKTHYLCRPRGDSRTYSLGGSGVAMVLGGGHGIGTTKDLQPPDMNFERHPKTELLTETNRTSL